LPPQLTFFARNRALCFLFCTRMHEPTANSKRMLFEIENSHLGFVNELGSVGRKRTARS
jgi:hypothetical protein